MAVATAFAPTVSALFARGDQAGLQSLSAKAACLSLLGTACAAIPLLLLAKPILAWFGPDFAAGAPIVTVLVLGQMLAAACGPQQHLITMTGHERAGATIFAVCAGSSFAACMLIIDSFGMMGAACAMTGNPYLLERGNGRLYPSMPASQAGPGCFIQSHAGKKARDGLWDLIVLGVLRCVTK